jgi:hypothetical protein
MKVFEILLEATTPTLKKVPNGWAWVTPDGQTYGGFKDQTAAQEWGKKNQSLLQKPAGAPATTPATTPSTTPGTPTAKPTAPGATQPFPGKYRADVRAGKKNFSSVYVKGRGFVELDANGKAVPSDKKKIIEKRNLSSKVKEKEQKFIQAFYKSRIVKYLGYKLAIFTPIMAWFEEMAEINVLFDDGFFNDSLDANGKPIKLDNVTAGAHAAEARSRATHIAAQKVVTELAAVAVILKTSPKLVMGFRALLMGIPGAGWLGMVAISAVQGLLVAMLTSNEMQTKIANLIMNEITTSMADVIGNTVGMMDATSAVGAYIDSKKAELTGGS